MDIKVSFDTEIKDLKNESLINDTRREIVVYPELFVDTRRTNLYTTTILFDTEIKESGRFISTNFQTKRIIVINNEIFFDTKNSLILFKNLKFDTKKITNNSIKVIIITKRIINKDEYINENTKRNVINTSLFFFNTERNIELRNQIITFDLRKITSKDYMVSFNTKRKTVINIYFEIWTERRVEKDITDFKKEVQRFYYLCTKFGDPFRYLDEDEAKRWYYYSKDKPLYPNITPDINLQTRSRFPERPLRDNLKISESKNYIEL